MSKEIRWKEFNSGVKFGKVRPSGFPRAKFKQLSSYTDFNLEISKSVTVIAHVGINDLLNGTNEHKLIV